jgi:hypothetical protein
MEDLQSTTRYVTWSLHTKSRSSLKAMLSKVTSPGGNQPGSNNNNGGGGGKGHHGHHGASSAAAEGSSGATADFLENTLWNRTLGSMSEEIVAALVCQIFEGAWPAGGKRLRLDGRERRALRALLLLLLG